MDEDMDIKLLVKSANQQIDDHVVQCKRDWTIKELKLYLSRTYPTTPKPNQQRLIFSGKLLLDEVTLKEVLKNYTDVSTLTIHLVCSGTAATPPTTSSTTLTPAPVASQPAPHTSARPPIQPTPDTANVSQQHPGEAWQQYMQQYQTMYQTYWNTYPSQYMSPQPYMRTGHASSHQYMDLRRMYANQYIMQYMQYYGYPRASMYPAPHVQPIHVPTNLPVPEQPLTPAAPAPDNVPMNNVAGVVAGANQNLVMNAQGGQMEDDEEFARDWLDWVYTFCRISILLSIIYFYSTFSRFAAVTLIFVVFYFYQNGYYHDILRLLIPPPAPAAPAQPEPSPPTQPEPSPPAQPEPSPPAQPEPSPPTHPEPSPPIQLEPSMPQTNPENQESDQSEAAVDEAELPSDEPQTEALSNTTEARTGAPPVIDTRPGSLYIAWCFVSSFFTSLLPQRPPEVNVN